MNTTTHIHLKIEGAAPVELAAFTAAIAHLGDITVQSSAVIQVKPVPLPGRMVWLQFTSDETEPYFLAEGPYLDGETSVDEELLQTILREGVCTALCCTYPRTDRYGLPISVQHEDGARETVSEHLIALAPDDAFTFEGSCTEDDTPEKLWLGVVIPS